MSEPEFNCFVDSFHSPECYAWWCDQRMPLFERFAGGHQIGDLVPEQEPVWAMLLSRDQLWSLRWLASFSGLSHTQVLSRLLGQTLDMPRDLVDSECKCDQGYNGVPIDVHKFYEKHGREDEWKDIERKLMEMLGISSRPEPKPVALSEDEPKEDAA